ncbi:MAG TPA: hypothetical protein PL182_00405 [Pseudobdellovibrionaceae bacterium]|nr:hypothetical protein [Pseudobdellovibrionaceae bacterium]
MKTQNVLKVFVLILAAPVFFGCAPSFHAETSEGSVMLGSQGEEGLLSKTSTGLKVLEEMEMIRFRGYSIEIQRVGADALASLGAKLSTYQVNGRTITIWIDESLDLKERAHAVAHEISRLKDEFDIEDYLKNHPEISKDVKEFWDLYDSKGFAGFDWKVVRFALGVAVCKEARAYFRNQNLSAEGLKTEKYVQGTSIGKYLSETYFSRLELVLKTLIEAQMTKLCSQYSSMNDLQESLSW